MSDYETRREATLANRLLTALEEHGIIPLTLADDIRYPSWEAIQDAEERAK